MPALEDVLAIPGAHLHLYGKEPRPGRKLGHVTLVDPTRASERRGGSSSAALVLAADAAVDAAAAGRADALPPLELERVLLQAGEEHRVADRHRQGSEDHDLRVKRHPGRPLRSRSSSRVRVRLEVQLPAAPIGYVRVELGRREVGVAEHLLDAAQVGAALEQMRREGVAEQVRVDALRLEARPSRRAGAGSGTRRRA